MSTIATSLKQKLQSGRQVAGLFCCTYSPQISEALGEIGLDFLLFDNEHTPNNAVNLHAQLCALKGCGTEAVLRLPMVDEFTIKLALDLGVRSLMLPNVKTPEEVQRMVRFAYYPPQGQRGIAGSVRAARYGRDLHYLQEANQQTSLIIQIESLQGVENLEAILQSSSHVDAVFLGPHDLAADIGLLGQPRHERVVALCVQAIRTATRLGKASGILCAPQDMAVFQEAGARMFVLGSDMGVLLNSAAQLLQRFEELANTRR
ncbi:HpcH/HpaI aldolase family protein [Comamonas testosteroni]|uniref:HpcH/HpaI aldolase family protein n=1 Tax=Comamonas testosteroni TaxID=285 RepID=UPI0005B41D48|nr:aldolase/citrate lyase family protein [Comamonas testosteroni]